MQVVRLDSGHAVLSSVELAVHFAEESCGALMRRNTSKFSSVFPSWYSWDARQSCIYE